MRDPDEQPISKSLMIAVFRQLHHDLAKLHLKLAATKQHFTLDGEKANERYLRLQIINLHEEIIQLHDRYGCESSDE